jgi:hypothetical protein
MPFKALGTHLSVSSTEDEFVTTHAVEQRHFSWIAMDYHFSRKPVTRGNLKMGHPMCLESSMSALAIYHCLRTGM